VTAHSNPGSPHDDVAELYCRHHRDLERAVARVVHAPRELIEDACQTAWTIMLRREPRPAMAFLWLRLVAIHEAYRLCRTHRETHLEDLADEGGWEAVVPGEATIEDAIEARRALRILAALPDQQRVDLALQVAGFSYAELQARTAGRTRTNVSKHLRKARARIRLAELPERGSVRRADPLHE
jgi:RNA polymerase sigma factor (sigma-70 family)